MKKLAVSLAMITFLATTATVWAGDSRAFSNAQEKEIRKIIGDFYPHGIKIVMEDDGWGNTRIACWAKGLDDYYIFTASAKGNVEVDEIFPGSVARKSRELEEKILQVLNPSAGVELGRDLIK